MVNELEGAYHHVQEVEAHEEKPKKQGKKEKKPQKETVQYKDGHFVNCDENGHCRKMNHKEKSYFMNWKKDFDKEMAEFSDEMKFMEKELNEMMTEEDAKEEKAKEEGHRPKLESKQNILDTLIDSL